MKAETMSREKAAEAVLVANPDMRLSLNTSHGRRQFEASAHWPNDVLRGKHCFGSGATLEKAIADCLQKVEDAKNAGPTLRTADECKQAVIALIREHDASPAAFRDAVDALPVAKHLL